MANTDEILTIGEVASVLKVSTRSVIRYIEAGKLRASKIGSWRVKRSDLDAFLETTSNLQKT